MSLFPDDNSWLLAVMDQDPSAPDPVEAYLCPGCGNWQVEYEIVYPIEPTRDTWFDHYSVLIRGAEGAAREHRAECSAFNVLAALQGAPT